VTDLELCQAALAKLQEADELLEQVTEDPPGGWCAGEALGYVQDAIGTLTPFRIALAVDNTRGQP
jgi:hypothetical protein